MISFGLSLSLFVKKSYSGLPRIREKSGKFKFFQGQGIVREFRILVNVKKLIENFEYTCTRFKSSY